MENLKQINNKINKLAKNGKVQEAIEYCKDLLIKEPSNSNLHIRLGDLYLDRHLDIHQSKQYIDDAINEYQQAAEVLIDNNEIYYKIANALFYKGEIDKAINYYNIAIEKKYNLAQCYFMLANCFKRKDRFQDALENTNLALKHSFLKSSRIHYLKFNLLNSLYFSKKSQKMAALCQLILSWLTFPFDKEAIKKFKEKGKWIQIIPVLIKAEALLNSGNINKSFELFSKIIDEMPGFSILYVAIGDAYRKIGKLDEAIVEYKMAIWIDPLNKSAFTGIVETYEEMGDYENLIAYYKKYIKINPNQAKLHANIANFYYLNGDIDEAIVHYQTAITLNPQKDFTSHVAQILGFVQQQLKNTDSAIACYQLAGVLLPKDMSVYISLGSAFYDNQDYKNALIVYRRALELDSKNSKIHCNLGYLYWGMGELDEAIKEYKLSIKYDPEYDIAQNNLGVIYLDDLVQINEAIKYFSAAVACNPNYALAYYNLGRSYALKGQNVEAAKYFQQAMDINNITNEIDPADIQDRLNNLFS